MIALFSKDRCAPTYQRNTHTHLVSFCQSCPKDISENIKTEGLIDSLTHLGLVMHILMTLCKNAVTPVCKQWSYCSVVLSHRLCVMKNSSNFHSYEYASHSCLYLFLSQEKTRKIASGQDDSLSTQKVDIQQTPTQEFNHWKVVTQ